MNCFTIGKIEDNVSSSNKTISIGGIGGELNKSYVKNCFSTIQIIANVNSGITSRTGGIIGSSNSGRIICCYYVAGNGSTDACPTSSTKTSLGAVTSANSAVFSTDNTTLTYNGTLCEVLNAYRLENDSNNSYKEWVVGEDGWPTFAE